MDDYPDYNGTPVLTNSSKSSIMQAFGDFNQSKRPAWFQSEQSLDLDEQFRQDQIPFKQQLKSNQHQVQTDLKEQKENFAKLYSLQESEQQQFNSQQNIIAQNSVDQKKNQEQIEYYYKSNKDSKNDDQIPHLQQQNSFKPKQQYEQKNDKQLLIYQQQQQEYELKLFEQQQKLKQQQQQQQQQYLYRQLLNQKTLQINNSSTENINQQFKPQTNMTNQRKDQQSPKVSQFDHEFPAMECSFQLQEQKQKHLQQKSGQQDNALPIINQQKKAFQKYIILETNVQNKRNYICQAPAPSYVVLDFTNKKKTEKNTIQVQLSLKDLMQ